jgi:hypothetical protein
VEVFYAFCYDSLVLPHLRNDETKERVIRQVAEFERRTTMKLPPKLLFMSPWIADFILKIAVVSSVG